MRYVAAYLLAALGGNEAPSAADIKKILDAVGASCDDDQLNTVISELKGKVIEEVIADGREKLASVPSGGAVVAGSSAPAGDAAAEEKAEEKEPEPEEESDDDMDGFSLFD
ncbi:60S acidic ribosomal protein P2 [Salpingoeca rosetta]|uniref:60S acidic ribosomal protein P2 n=1 Tax=Salpingoeca rosetta (strain ATCC 50818 / BSB-021) TaxID=946362 RepID=F2UBA3_SALR5|nr:60S acidic ribosomal protein P2 [Salpingoeca rosetta]EGD73769.1 60S acidic ribosomal protein P2 [Salpingoeca rosetta]|eukprot:XP_004993332.1 60S acidic ribosomal protein P2 [Salpingoeca rosetta]